MVLKERVEDFEIFATHVNKTADESHIPIVLGQLIWNNRTREFLKTRQKTKETVGWVCIYLKDLMPNTVLTLIYNIIKVKRRDKLNKVQTMSLYTISSAGLPVPIHIKHRKYKNKSPGNKRFQDCLKLVVLLTRTFKSSGLYQKDENVLLLFLFLN